MGYRHIDNLYKNQTILQFRECYATEKIHGTSAHIAWKDGRMTLFPGGCKLSVFETCFDLVDLEMRIRAMEKESMTIFGEQYGGKQQGMSAHYGADPKFVAFEVRIGDYWLDVPRSEAVAVGLGLEFVPYERIPCTLEAIDRERDRDSIVAIRRGMGPGHKREGVVLRPITEWIHQSGNGTIRVKHKRDDLRETATPRKVGDDPLERQEGWAAAQEWVTAERMRHVCDHLVAELGHDLTERDTQAVIEAMIADVLREGGSEVANNRATRRAVGGAAVMAYRQWMLHQGSGSHG